MPTRNSLSHDDAPVANSSTAVQFSWRTRTNFPGLSEDGVVHVKGVAVSPFVHAGFLLLLADREDRRTAASPLLQSLLSASGPRHQLPAYPGPSSSLWLNKDHPEVRSIAS
jgi:hypothetical protein